jgi:hypothetical protein
MSLQWPLTDPERVLHVTEVAVIGPRRSGHRNVFVSREVV